MPDIPLADKLEEQLKTADKYADSVEGWYVKRGVPRWMAAFIGAATAAPMFGVMVLWKVIVDGLLAIGSFFATSILKGVSQAKRDDAGDFNEVIAAAVSEFLGIELTAEDIPNGKGPAAMVARMRVMGDKFHEQLLNTFGGLREISAQDGADNARSFTGYALNFAISNAFISILTEAESLGFLKNFRELGEEAVQALGLGRLQRLALQPLIRNMIQQPYDLFLKSKLRPDRLSDAQYVRAMQRGTMSKDEVRTALAEKGYPDALIDEIFIDSLSHIGDSAFVRAMQRGVLTETETRNRLKQKGYPDEEIDQIILDGLHHLSDADLSRLVRYGEIPVDIAQAELIQQGIPRDHADQILKANTLTRVDSIVSSFVNKLESQYINGFIDEDGFNKGLEMVPLSDEEKQWERNFVGQALDAPQTTLSFSQVKSGIVNGILDFDYLDRWLIRQGYSDEDQLYLEYEILQAMDKTASKQDIASGKTARRAAQPLTSKVAPTITRP